MGVPKNLRDTLALGTDLKLALKEEDMQRSSLVHQLLPPSGVNLNKQTYIYAKVRWDRIINVDLLSCADFVRAYRKTGILIY